MTHAPAHPVIWAELPVTNLVAARDFYVKVTGMEAEGMEMGGQDIVVLKGAERGSVSVNLYEGRPAADGAGPTLHLVVDGPVEEAATRCWEAGGTVLGDPVPIPEGRFVYAKDPDGNSLGLFETKAS
jgi:predicted enzyme related to lactoylglutathione lyase